MADQQFTSSISEFERWRDAIARELKMFRMWLRRNSLDDQEIDEQVQHQLEDLAIDHLTIAFAGEFSRGKTELINAIFFADYGQRILPSQAGRTTMCPTELVFDHSVNGNYLRLLPIETRLQDTPLSDYREMVERWVEIPLASDEATEMAEAMQTITQTKSVYRSEALQLGFDVTMLDEDEVDPERVEIPAWRHAMISFRHPLLEQGLRIVDTPGLNALGSEPELTYQLLPQAQAVVFVLAADAGVTASDLHIWEDHIEQLKNRPNLGLYAALNKVDVLWDDLSGPKKTEKAINRVIRQTSRHLQIPEDDILPVSAQKGLIAKIRDDRDLLNKSHITELESILSDTVIGNKSKMMWGSIIEKSHHLIKDSQNLIKSQKEQIEKQRDEIAGLKGSAESELNALIENSKATQQEFKKRQLALKPSQRLLQRQAEVLVDRISRENVEHTLQNTLQDMVDSRTSMGMMKAAKNFYQSVENMMNEFCREAELTNKMAESMYTKFSSDFNVELLEARYMRAKAYRRELQLMIDESKQINRHLLLTLSEQSVAVKRFFQTTAANVARFFNQLRSDVRLWSSEILLPLLQQVRSLKDLLESNHKQLMDLHHNEATVEGRLKALNQMIYELDNEIANAETIIINLQNIMPKQNQSNVVALAQIRR